MTEIALRAYETEVDQMVEQGRYLEALAHLRHVLDHFPKYAGAYYLLGKMLLEADLPELAIDTFRRVLNADPEHLLARIGLGLAHDRLEHASAAIWNFERALEITPGDQTLTHELQQFLAQRDGAAPDTIPLTRAGLARLYMRGHLYSRAIEELNRLAEANGNRVDILVALAEAYWRDDQIVQAANTSQRILDAFPYCLKANLLLGTLWQEGGQEEGKRHLKRAQDVDPENRLAAEIFGTESPLETKEVSIERLTYHPQAIEVDQTADWFRRLEAASVSIGISEAPPDMSEEEMRLVDITAGLESQLQIPDWLRDLGPLMDIEETAEADWMAPQEPAETLGEIASDELANWLSASSGPVQEMEAPASPTTGKVPDWLQALEPGTTGVEEKEEEVPDWLQELQAPEAPEPQIAVTPLEETEELPDWLQELQPPAAVQPEVRETPKTMRQEEETAGPVQQEAEGLFGWDSFPDEERPGMAVPDEVLEWGAAADTEEALLEMPPSEADELPDWLKALQPPAQEPQKPGAVAAEKPEEEEPLPDWLRELKPPSETPAERESGPVESSDMFGWVSLPQEEAEALPEEQETPDWLSQLEPEPTGQAPAWLEELAPPTAGAPEAGASEEEGLPAWIDELQPEEEAAVPTVETAEAPQVDGDLLSGDDALAWFESLTVGKEDELRAQAEAEAKARVDEIMGRAAPRPVSAPPEPAPEPEAVVAAAPVAAAAPPPA
ncbi:MAG: tetratricopeptide repeat protein, partial [Anaerolineae bacterium]|nr:tetratricopeptide repeat protein [Anaerolineae bacterium]